MSAQKWMENGRAFRSKIVNFLDCDLNNRLFPHWIMGEFSEIAGDPYLAAGQTYESGLARGQIWVVARMSMGVSRMPCSEEELLVSLWFRGDDGKYLFHDCEFRSPQGELLISCSAAHRPMDLFRRCAIPVSEIADRLIAPVDARAAAPECRRIMPQGPLVPLGSRKMMFSDLDRNRHGNNAIYTRIAQDFLPPEYWDRPLAEYMVNFVRSAGLNDVLDISGQPTPRGYLLVGSREHDVCFSSEFTFN